MGGREGGREREREGILMSICSCLRMDKDGNVLISWEEWRGYLILQPHTSVQSIFENHATVSEYEG